MKKTSNKTSKPHRTHRAMGCRAFADTMMVPPPSRTAFRKRLKQVLRGLVDEEQLSKAKSKLVMACHDAGMDVSVEIVIPRDPRKLASYDGRIRFL